MKDLELEEEQRGEAEWLGLGVTQEGSVCGRN